jgi:uncharacterized membrane protein
MMTASGCTLDCTLRGGDARLGQQHDMSVGSKSHPLRKEQCAMATLVAIGYPDEGTAEQARETVQQLESELIIQADQVAAISRDPEGKYHVHTTHGGASAGGGEGWGGFWGLLFGMLFFIPFAGLALGAGLEALFGHMGEKGIDKAFQEQVRDCVKPGTSALFMVIEQATPDKAVAALQQYGGTVIKTSLSEEDTKRLQEALQPPEPTGQPVVERTTQSAAAGLVGAGSCIEGAIRKR